VTKLFKKENKQHFNNINLISELHTMKLVYRGIAYTPNGSLVPVVETATFATYRGLTYNCRRPVILPTAPQVPLKYRGIAYNIKPTPTPQPQPQKTSKPTIAFNS
jgi:hypothetical protein